MTDEEISDRARRYRYSHDFTSKPCYHGEHRDCELTCSYCMGLCQCSCHRIALRKASPAD